jgi:pilus assembly protein CpaE
MASKLSVVIIDSDVESIKSMQKYIGKLGDHVSVEGVSSNFDGGYELIHRKRPSLVIMEIGDDVSVAAERIQTILSRFPQVSVFGTSDDRSSDTILSLMRAGMSEYILRPVTEVDLVCALQKIGRLWLVKPVEGKERGLVYSAFSPKGGVGCTTLAINLATNIHQITGKPTLLMDLDMTAGDVTTFLNIRPAYSMTDVISNVTRLDKSFLQGVITRHDSGIQVLAEPQSIGENISFTCENFRRVMDIIRTMFSYVVLDVKASLDDCNSAALEMSDVILMVFVLSLPGIRNIQRYMDYFEKKGIGKGNLQLVVSRYVKKGDIRLEDAERILRQKISFTIPNEYETAMACLNKGMPASSFDAKSKLNLAIREIAQSVVSRKK